MAITSRPGTAGTLAAGALFFALPLFSADRPWQQITTPSAAEAAANFRTPPPEYGLTMWWGWDGPITEEVITRDLDGFLARGVRAVTIEPGYKMDNAPYLSPAWFQMMKTAVEQARKRGMKVWVVDEGKYPSGFAGGKFSAEHPELRMQALVVAERVPVAAGETVVRKLTPDTVGVVAVNAMAGTNQVLDTPSGSLNWKAPEGGWQVFLVEHRFKSSPTRSANNPTRGKDDKASLEDYLDPAATRQFLAFTHEQYSKVIGEEFGKTVLGFRGDEPDYSIAGIPWTPAIFDEFRRRKGYDVRPYAPAFLAPSLTDEQKRAKADYWDVWSAMFRDNFFKIQADWCAAHNLEYLVHLNHEDAMMQLARSEGDFFRDMRFVQIPGIDTIWNQIWPGKVADFPKYASSAAHLDGHPRAFTESFAAYNPAPTPAEAKWVLDQQFARGINMIEIMFTPSSAASGHFAMRGWTGSDQFPSLASYIDRASYLLSIGRPAADIAVYHPATSMWLGDEDANKTTLSVMQNLLEHQRDFDFVDDDALASLLTLRGAAFRTSSGNEYRTVVVPGATAISKRALDRLQAFAKAGGKVIFCAKLPSVLVDVSFLKASKPASLDWAVFQPALETGTIPHPDVTLDRAAPAIKYVHRRWRDADLYFFFNESDTPQPVSVTLAGNGTGQVWDATSGQISAAKKSGAALLLDLAPRESKFILLATAGGA